MGNCILAGSHIPVSILFVVSYLLFLSSYMNLYYITDEHYKIQKCLMTTVAHNSEYVSIIQRCNHIIYS